MSLALDFSQNVDSVIISERARHLIVVHRQVIFLNAPEFGQPRGVDDFKHTRVFVFPSDIRSISLLGVV